MKNWIKGSVIGLSMAVASVLGGATQAAVFSSATFTALSPGFSTTSGANGVNGLSVYNGDLLAFDFSTLQFSSIVSFVLDVVYSKTADTLTEAWTGKITGTNTAGASSPFSLAGTNAVQLNNGVTLISGAAFTTAALDKMFKVTFNDTNPAGTDKFYLKTDCIAPSCSSPLNTTLTINYMPPVPLPAGGLLLLTGLGGLILARRRKV